MSDVASEVDRRRDAELADIRRVMATAEGRRFLFRLLAEARIFQEPGPSNADRLNYENGRRGFGLMLYSDAMQADIRAFRQMEFENTELAAAVLEQQQKREDDEVS